MEESRPLRVRFTVRALEDLESIVTYPHERSPTGAHNVAQRIKAAIDGLEEFPLMGQRTSDPTIRRPVAMPYPYIVLYEPRESEVVIHAVRHAARRDASLVDDLSSDG